MLSSLANESGCVVDTLQLTGLRIVISGYARGSCHKLSQALGQRRAHVVVQTDGDAASDVIAAFEGAAHVTVDAAPFASGMAAVRFTQAAAKQLGGLDVLVNVIHVPTRLLEGAATLDQVEDAIHDLLLPASLTSRVAANRMRVMRCEGVILNVLVAAPVEGHDASSAQILRTALAAMTRHEATHWADTGIRVNAIVSGGDIDDPETGVPASAADISDSIMTLAGPDGTRLSGLVFDAKGVAAACC